MKTNKELKNAPTSDSSAIPADLFELNDSVNKDNLHPTVQDFRTFIYKTQSAYIQLSLMLHEGPKMTHQPRAHVPWLTSIDNFMVHLNNLLTMNPPWIGDGRSDCLVGVPMNMLLSTYMSTPSGWAFFVREDVNLHLKKILNCWAKYLESPASAAAMSQPGGWLEPINRRRLEVATDLSESPRPFWELYKCPNPKDTKTFGFKSWDAFFTREFQPGIRPVHKGEANSTAVHKLPPVVLHACESKPLKIAYNVQATDTFWLKEQPYSMLDMLDNHQFAPRFIGGTVYQAYLSALSYHRWHAPVTGRVVGICNVDGTYYAQCPAHTFLDPEAQGGTDTSPPMESQAYLAVVATRGLIFIEADNEEVGCVCVVAIGMAECSSCEITVKEGQYVVAGEEIGMFHYGGSTYCIVFEPGRVIDLVDPPPFDPSRILTVNSLMGTVYRR